MPREIISGKVNHYISGEELTSLIEKLPLNTIPMKEVMHWMYYPILHDGKSLYQVITYPDENKKAMELINASLTSHPIVVIEDEFDPYGCILSGEYRFAKYYLSGKKKLKYYYIPFKEIQRIKKPIQ